jgi:hypothetical protein
MPAHVERHLIATGVLTPERLGRAAQLRRCTRCRAVVIVGLDSHRCALVVTCDPVILDQVGEAFAWLTGRQTYELWGLELERRDQWKITAGMKKPVIGEHQCGVDKTPDPKILALFIPAEKQASDNEVPF